MNNAKLNNNKLKIYLYLMKKNIFIKLYEKIY